MARAAANYVLLLLTLFSIFCFTSAACTTTTTANGDFIKSQCNLTIYQPLCISTFSNYANKICRSHYKLTKTALSLMLTQANSTETYILELEEQQRGDCSSLMEDSVSLLKDSIKELKKMNGSNSSDFAWQKSNVQTWTSAAYTNSDTCLDEVNDMSDGGDQKLKDLIAYLQKLNSISLTFVNHYD